MVKVKIIGGLGNQMFQYAAAKALAVKNDTQVIADISAFRSYKVHPFRLNQLSCSCIYHSSNDYLYRLLSLPYVQKRLIRRKRFLNYFFEKQLTFDADVLDSNQNVVLSGYFQSEKYFFEIRNILLEEFSLTRAITELEAKVEKEINENESVAIHIRRGDYISDLSANSVHGICSEGYFLKALSYLKENKIISSNCKLFIFSDDIRWCKNNLKFDYRTIFVEGSAERPEVDIHLMSKCQHQVISNSTFSWWGAWLNINSNKCVIAPQRWFNTVHDATDIVPEQWVRL